MKKIILPLLSMFFMFSCSDSISLENHEDGDNTSTKVVTITAPSIEYIFCGDDGIITRAGYLDYNPTGPSFTNFFDNGDVFGIFPSAGYQINFEVSGLETASNRVELRAEGWGTKAGIQYSCYYPFNYDFKDSRAIPFSYVGQKQSRSGEHSHLYNYSFLVSKPVSDPERTGLFNFETNELGTTLCFNIAVPDATKTYTKFEIFMPNEEFTLAGTVNLFAEEGQNPVTPIVTSHTLSLDLDDLTVASSTERLALFVRVAPINLNGADFRYRFYTSDGKLYEKKVTRTENYLANKAYGYGVSSSGYSEIPVTSQASSNSQLEEAFMDAVGKTSDVNLDYSVEATNNITIPAEITERSGAIVNLNFTNPLQGVGSENAVTIASSNLNPLVSTSLSNVVLTTPTIANGGNVDPPSLTINLPTSTVTLTASGESGYTYYNVVNSTTADNTLVIGDNVYIKTLYIYQGNVVINESAIVEKIFDCSNGHSTITDWSKGDSTSGELNAITGGYTSGN